MHQLRVGFARGEDEPVCRRFDSHFPVQRLSGKIDAQELILASLAGMPIGYLRLESLWGQVPYIGLIWVEPAHRGGGVGRAMLGFLERHLWERGYRVLLSSSQVDEAAPQAWHRGAGFSECGILAGINPGGVGEVFFRKVLADPSPVC